MSSWGDMNSTVYGIVLCVFAVGCFAFQLQEANKVGNSEDEKIHPLEMN